MSSMKFLMKKLSESYHIDPTCSCALQFILLATVCFMILSPTHARCADELPPSGIDNPASDLSFDDSSEKIFGAATGYIHPFLSLEEAYSDNIFNTAENEKKDFYTTISPGLWVATPRSKEIVLNIDPSNTAPGGLAYEFQKVNVQKKFQAYALYEADIIRYASESQNNTTDHTAEGMLAYAFTNGLSFQFVDQYLRSFDAFQSDGSHDNELQKYDSNVVRLSADYALSPKFSVEGAYSNFYLNYDNADRAYRDRTDNSGSLYVNYTYSSKTTFFVNGEYTKSSFDTATDKDADQYNIYTGMQWQPSGKTNLRTRLGYVNRSFDSGDIEDASEFAGDIRIRYNFTRRTSVTLLGASNVQVPDTRDYVYMRNNILSFGYRQSITPKITASLIADVAKRDYKGVVLPDRKDDYFELTPAIQYDFKEWMMARLSYSYLNRDSNIDINDYNSNMFILRVIFSL